MERVTKSLEEFEKVAEEFARGLRPRAAGAILVTLSGNLGAGKTAFTKAVARALGITDIVNSPTFVLEKIYAIPHESAPRGFVRLVHIDAYRLDSGADLSSIGFDEIMYDASNLVFLEWPEKVAEALPPAAVSISISILGPDSRKIEILKPR